MNERIILVDFAGTLVKHQIIQEANEFRSSILKRALPSDYEHAHSEELYKANREFVEKLTGIQKDMSILYREQNLDTVILNGEQVQNQIATNLFQIGMYMVAKKYKENIFFNGFIDELYRIKKLNYKLAIVSGVRTDIISGMLALAGQSSLFDYIYAEPSQLGMNNLIKTEELSSHGVISYAIGDKFSDLEAGKAFHAKTIFVNWGTPTGGEEDFSDFGPLSHPKELQNIIKE